jgi:hypothetical protein
MSPWPPDNELLLERYAYVCTQLRAAQNAGNRADVGRWQAEKDEIVQRFDGMVSSRRAWRFAAVIVTALIIIAAVAA